MTKHLIQCLLCLSLLGTIPVVANAVESTALTAQVSVSGQMTDEKFNRLLSQGFKSVIVNRPDDEIGNLITAHQLRIIAE